MAPIYGRSMSGERAVISKPNKYGNKITMISGISVEKIEASIYGKWSANSEIFTQFIIQCLCPVLKPRHVVIIDNVRFHKTPEVARLIHNTGAKLIYLPPYSPELNPIEEMWSKIKHILRKLSARTINKFKKAIKRAFNAVTKKDLIGWFKHAGYKRSFV